MFLDSTISSRISSGASSALANRGVRTITNIRFSATPLTSYPDGIASPSNTKDQERWRQQADTNPILSQPCENPFKGVGRNDPCPCGSGKKFKKCCLP